MAYNLNPLDCARKFTTYSTINDIIQILNNLEHYDENQLREFLEDVQYIESYLS